MSAEAIKAKSALVEEIAAKLKGAQSAVVVEYRGLSVAEMTELRNNLRAEDVELKVYKNSLVQRATVATEYEGLNAELTGPNAIALGNSDAVAPARVIAKFAKDLRIMSSGPRAGFMEIELPALSPGSSIMPGKINPTVPEMVVQIAHQVIGNDVAISVALYDGELDLNVWDATFYKCLFESFSLVEREVTIFRRDCVESITANRSRCMEEAAASIALSTIVATCYGYPTGVKVAQYAADRGCKVQDAVVELGLMTKEEADTLVNPILMTDPERIDAAAAEFKRRHANVKKA